MKGAKRVGVRLGNWLTADQSRALLQAVDGESLRGRRDRAILAVMLACGLRRSEVADLTVNHFQQREDRWVIADLIGKAAHIRTVPVPNWVKAVIDRWTAAAGITVGPLFRCISRRGTVWGERITEKVISWLRSARPERASRSCRPMTAAGPAPTLSCSGRRTGADSIPARACVRRNDRAIPGLQTTVAGGRERQNRFGAVGGRSATSAVTPLLHRLSECDYGRHMWNRLWCLAAALHERNCSESSDAERCYSFAICLEHNSDLRAVRGYMLQVVPTVNVHVRLRLDPIGV